MPNKRVESNSLRLRFAPPLAAHAQRYAPRTLLSSSQVTNGKPTH